MNGGTENCIFNIFKLEKSSIKSFLFNVNETTVSAKKNSGTDPEFPSGAKFYEKPHEIKNPRPSPKFVNEIKFCLLSLNYVNSQNIFTFLLSSACPSFASISARVIFFFFFFFFSSFSSLAGGFLSIGGNR